MKILSNKKRAAAIGAVTASTVLVGGVAFAYWTSTGSGTGTATTGTSSDTWTVAVTSTDTKNLAPTTATGTPSQTVAYSITNNGTGQQLLSKAVISIDSVTPGSGSGPACTTSDFSLNGTTAGAAVTDNYAANLAAGASSSGSVVLRLIDNEANQDNCKSATVTLKVDAS